MRDGRTPASRPQLPDGEGLEDLRAEIEARTAEAAWLQQHYQEQLREAFQTISELEARLSSQITPPATPLPAEESELARLREEVVRLEAAENRYLDRIEELKELLAVHKRATG